MVMSWVDRYDVCILFELTREYSYKWCFPESGLGGMKDEIKAFKIQSVTNL